MIGGQMPDFDYDPLHDPFALPVARAHLACRADTPIHLPFVEGATVGTTLAGAWHPAFRRTVCAARRAGERHCLTARDEAEVCHRPDACAAPTLLKPYSVVHRRAMATPVLLRAPDLECGEPCSTFELEVTLLGRRALRLRNEVLESLHKLARRGLVAHGEAVPFRIEDHTASPVRSLGEWVGDFIAFSPPRIQLVFEAPTLHQEKVRGADGRMSKQYVASGAPPLAGLMGNAAYELVAWDIEDRDVGEAVDRYRRDALASEARDAAREAAGNLNVLRALLEPIDLGTRRVGRGEVEQLIQGFLGTVELAGDLRGALPWLVWMALGRCGQNRAKGFGEMSLWGAGPHVGPPWGQEGDEFGGESA